MFKIPNGNNATYIPAINISQVAKTPIGVLNLMFKVCKKKPNDISM